MTAFAGVVQPGGSWHGQDTVVLAEAFQSGWSPSPWNRVDFIIDRTPPEILAFPIPAPNAAGWSNGPVTVSFRCVDDAGIRSCSAPITVTTDGTTTVEGVGVDAVGNQRPASVVVRIDRTAPAIALTGEWAAETSESAVTVTGTAADGGTGVARVSCNGEEATLATDGTFSCSVSLRPGLNPVVIHAVDLAGNGRSAGRRITRVAAVESITVSPASATIGVGESRELHAVDQAGLPVTTADWSVDNAAGLSLTTAEGRASISGLAPAAVTVTATLGTLSATATISVLEGALPVGAVRWESPPVTRGGAVAPGPLLANRVDASVPDLYVLEGTPTGQQSLRGVFADGTPGTDWSVPSSSGMVLADRSGGVVLDNRTYAEGPARRQQLFDGAHCAPSHVEGSVRLAAVPRRHSCSSASGWRSRMRWRCLTTWPSRSQRCNCRLTVYGLTSASEPRSRFEMSISTPEGRTLPVLDPSAVSVRARRCPAVADSSARWRSP
jgi:hypothetical protein